ncbi:MAG: energy transducer TonB [Planctomycetota bacterium]|nr:energy transducer TonB [Planctomycetota bacterium]
MTLAKRSLTASCVLHLAALTGLAAWTASTDTVRPRFAGQSEAIELVVTRAESTWSPEPITFENAAVDEVRVTVEPTTATIARKHFDQMNATELSFDSIIADTLPETSQIELDLAERPRSNSPVSITTTLPLQAITLPRQPPEPRELLAAVVQPPRSVGTDRTAPSFTTSPPPNYPTVAIQNNWEGTVLLRVYIDAGGTVDEVEVARSSGHPVLDGAAVTAVRRWRGSPATQNGQAISTTELLPVRFKLRD